MSDGDEGMAGTVGVVTTITEKRTVSPLLGWLTCMLAAAGLMGVAIAADVSCGSWAMWVWSITEVCLIGLALVLIVWAMWWHRPRWLFVLVPLTLITCAALGFVAYTTWGMAFSCRLAAAVL